LGFNPTQERLKATQEVLKERTELKTAA